MLWSFRPCMNLLLAIWGFRHRLASSLMFQSWLSLGLMPCRVRIWIIYMLMNVPELAELGADAVPCTNMDHLHAYDPSARLLARCNHCRLEPLNPAEDARHVTNATQEQIQSLPLRLQRWVYQFQPG